MMKFRDFLEIYGTATPPGLHWPGQHADIPQSFGAMAQQSQLNRNNQLQIDAVQHLQQIINTIWPNRGLYGATVSGVFPNAVITLPSIVNPRTISSRGLTIAGSSLYTCTQLGMLKDDGTTTTINVKPIYDFKMKQHPITKIAGAADQVLQGATSGGEPNVQNWRYPGQ